MDWMACLALHAATSRPGCQAFIRGVGSLVAECQMQSSYVSSLTNLQLAQLDTRSHWLNAVGQPVPIARFLQEDWHHEQPLMHLLPLCKMALMVMLVIGHLHFIVFITQRAQSFFRNSCSLVPNLPEVFSFLMGTVAPWHQVPPFWARVCATKGKKEGRCCWSPTHAVCMA